MRRAAKWPVLGAAILGAIQFVPLDRRDLTAKDGLVAPPPVKAALRNACYDCHSNQTRWRWYSAVAPASWLIAHDVNEGRRRLNFSNWADYTSDPATESHKLDQIAKFVAGGEMAPWYYRALHPGARLSKEQRSLIVNWARKQVRRASE